MPFLDGNLNRWLQLNPRKSFNGKYNMVILQVYNQLQEKIQWLSDRQQS